MLGDTIALFGAGVASFLAPCLVPLLPAYLAVIAGEDREATSVRATLVFVAGFALVFAVLGAVAGLIGSSLDRAQGVVQRVGGVLVIVMGLALLGVLRGAFQQERRLLGLGLQSTAAGGRRWVWAQGPLRPFVLGVAFGAAWTPCVGPLLGAALTVAAVSGEAGRGSALLLAYAAGIGVPFVLASLGLASSPRVTAALRRIGPPLQKVGGAAMVVLGVLLISGLYGHLTSYLARFSPSIAGL